MSMKWVSGWVPQSYNFKYRAVVVEVATAVTISSAKGMATSSALPLPRRPWPHRCYSFTMYMAAVTAIKIKLDVLHTFSWINLLFPWINTSRRFV